MKRVNGEGSYYVRDDTVKFIITIDGKRKQFYGSTKKKAYDKYINYLKEVKEHKPKSTYTFAAVIDLWWECYSDGEDAGYEFGYYDGHNKGILEAD